jgi:hypothetical protein
LRPAFQGRKKLKIEWDNGPNATYDSEQYKKELQATARKSGKVIRNEGDAESALSKGGSVFEADYYVPLLAHAPMEPMVATAEFKDGKLTAWAPTQNPQAAQAIIAQELGIAKENVICNVTLLGGGFGRKSKPDYVAEAAVLSKRVGRPVKVVWTREDDIKFDYFNAVAAMYMKAAIDAKGKPTAWLQRSVFPPITSIFDVNAVYGDPGHLQQGWTDVPYDIPNLRVENGPAPAHVRIGWLRSVANIYHAFAVQTFTDELAHRAGRDPLEYLLELIGPPRTLNFSGVDYPNYGADFGAYPWETGRLRQVIEIVAEKSGWGKRKFSKGSGVGIAAHRSFLTYVAAVVEVEVSDQGDIKIPRVDYVVDAGRVVNPEVTRAQFEGAAVCGTSVARSGEITAKNGVIEQSNFDTYPVARINEAPYQTNSLNVRLNDGGVRTLTGERIFLNLGTHPSIPSVPGLAESEPLTNIELLELDRLPEHLIVLGGGYVGLEFAQAYRRFGSRVTILERDPQLLPNQDRDVVAALLQIFARDGIDVIAGAKIVSVQGRSGTDVSLIVRTSSGEKTITGSDILVATGRTPNTAGIGLEVAGVELNQRGYVKVNDRLQTTAPNVWAIGECAGSPQFTHISLGDFRFIRDNLAGINRTTRDRLLHPEHIDKRWLRFSFPTFWHYDVLRGLGCRV